MEFLQNKSVSFHLALDGLGLYDEFRQWSVISPKLRLGINGQFSLSCCQSLWYSGFVHANCIPPSTVTCTVLYVVLNECRKVSNKINWTEETHRIIHCKLALFDHNIYIFHQEWLFMCSRFSWPIKQKLAFVSIIRRTNVAATKSIKLIKLTSFRMRHVDRKLSIRSNGEIECQLDSWLSSWGNENQLQPTTLLSWQTKSIQWNLHKLQIIIHRNQWSPFQSDPMESVIDTLYKLSQSQ